VLSIEYYLTNRKSEIRKIKRALEFDFQSLDFSKFPHFLFYYGVGLGLIKYRLNGTNGILVHGIETTDEPQIHTDRSVVSLIRVNPCLSVVKLYFRT
jgi:hypothetical protein